MLNEVKRFLDNFVKIELEAQRAYQVPDLNDLNKKVRLLYSHCHEVMNGGLNITESTELKDPEFYEAIKDARYKHERVIFKISWYKHPKWDDLYLAYTSGSMLSTVDYATYEDCLFISKVDGEYKVIGSAFVNNEHLDNIHWVLLKNPGDLSIDDSGELQETARFVSPVHDEFDPEISAFSIQEHEAEK